MTILADACVLISLAAHADESVYGVLHVAPGVEETYDTCSAGHSEMIVAG